MKTPFKPKLFFAIACNLAVIGTLHAQELLEGDEKDACEALLCLSSGDRPSECIPPIQRYLSIKKKTSQKTANARRDFLNLCPESNKDSKMQSLVNAIANGAGRCDAASLNMENRKTVMATICDGKVIGYAGQPIPSVTRTLPNGKSMTYIPNYESCSENAVTVIDPDKPSHCAIYEDHEYTFEISSQAVYVGDPLFGGHFE